MEGGNDPARSRLDFALGQLDGARFALSRKPHFPETRLPAPVSPGDSRPPVLQFTPAVAIDNAKREDFTAYRDG
jgi:hypothetical protein